MALLYDTYFVTLISFILFLALLYWKKVHVLLLDALDSRAKRIREELEDARRLREEAQQLLASYERKHKEVEQHAADIVARAKQDAHAAADQAKLDLQASVERRVRTAEEQIKATEDSAILEIKNRAVAIAAAAVAETIRAEQSDDAASRRIDAAIDDVGRLLH